MCKTSMVSKILEGFLQSVSKRSLNDRLSSLVTDVKYLYKAYIECLSCKNDGLGFISESDITSRRQGIC